jgi:hypothetical protein
MLLLLKEKVTMEINFFFWLYWDLNSGLYICYTGSLPLESCLYLFCSGYSGYLGDRVLTFAQAGLDLNPIILPAIAGMTCA